MKKLDSDVNRFLGGVRQGVKALTFLLTVGAVGSGWAEGGYVTLTANSDYNAGFADAQWSETVDDPSTRDYLVANGKKLTTKNAETVDARSLTFGEVNGTKGTFFQYYSATFNNEGLIFANGEYYQHYANVTLSGKTKVISPASAPFLFYNDSSKANDTLTFPGDFSSADEDCGIVVYAANNKNFTFALTGTSENYLGSIVVTSRYDSAGAPWGTNLKLGTAKLPGSVTMGDGTKLMVSAACELGSLTLTDGVALEFSQDLTVKSFTWTGTERIPLTWKGGPSKVPVAEETIVPILTMPIGSAVGLKDFVLVNETFDGKMPVLAMIEDVAAGTKTLAGVYYSLVTLNSRDGLTTGNVNTSSPYDYNSMIAAENWSDKSNVHDKAWYSVSRINGGTPFVTPFGTDAVCEFPGVALTLGERTLLVLQGLEFDVPILNVTKDLTIYGLWNPGRLQRVKFDRLVMADGAAITNQMRNAANLVLEGPISGSETTVITLMGAPGATSACETLNTLDGDNSKFRGKIVVTAATNRATEEHGFTTLYVKDGTNLGGARSAFTYDALSIDNLCVLDALAPVTLDEPTRGIFVESSAKLTTSGVKGNCVRFNVGDAAHALSIRETITLNGTIRKTGAGALALGGALKFLDANTNLTDTVPAREDLHKLIMTGGQLKPLAARSMDGLDIVFSNKVSKLAVGLTIDAATTDAELAQYGFIDLKTANPLVATEKTGTVPLTLENLPADPKEAFSVPICTVRKSVAEDVLALLVPAEKRVMLGNVKAKITLSASEPFTLDGFEAVTIKADVTPPAGMLLLVR